MFVTILSFFGLMIALISNGNNLVEKSPPVKSVLKKVDYGGFLSDSSLSLAYGRQGGISPFQTDETIIRYDNGYNNDAVGLTSGGTFQVAAYFPAAYMVQFAGMKLTKIEYFIYDLPTSCVLKVYGSGTSTSPGSLLYQQTITPNLYWNNTELSTQVDISGQDLWIGYEVTHNLGEWPAGIDAGPAIAGFGDKIYVNGVWGNLSGYGLNFNWNLAGHLDVGSQQTIDADFSADTLTGTAPHTVHFTDLSTGSPTTWQWDFNNDGIIDSEEQHPVWIYNDPGTYTVSLSVSDGTNSNTETKLDYVVVVAPESGIINILPGQRTDGSKILDIEFDLYGNEPEYYVWLDVSFDNGVNFQTVNAVSGDTGWIAPAQNRQIIWDAGDEFPDGFYSKTMRVKVSADFSIANPPTVTTAAISNITSTTATSGGNVTSDGGASVTARGVVWSTSANPTIEQNQGMTNDGEGTGEFVSNLTGLSASTTYFLRAYATNSAGTAYGDELSFTTTSNELFSEDFESYSSGQKLVQQAISQGKEYWTTWSNSPGSSEDPYISSLYSYGGTKSVVCQNENDFTLLLGNKTSGKYSLDFYLYIPTGKVGYYNILQAWSPNGVGAIWGLEINYNPGGIAEVTANGTTGVTVFNYSYNTWIYMEHIVDLNNDEATLKANGVEILTWTWSNGASGSGINQLAAMDIYAATTNGTPYFFIDNISFKQYNPLVLTTSVTNITATTATSGGNVTSDGGASVTARGVVWSTSANPTIEQNQGMTNDGEGTGEFVSSLTGLSASTTYFLRAYATNSAGTAYGDELSFTTISSFPCGSSFIDQRDGKTYTTVQIGTQCWMKQNLNIGTRINGTSNQTNNGTIEKYCNNNTELKCTTYGGLYQWNEIMGYTTTPGVQGICPDGWHLPTDAEWTALTTYLGGEGVAGGKMKETGTTHWNSPNTGATNSSGFTGLPGGYRGLYGAFTNIGDYGYFWSSSEYSTPDAWNRFLGYYSAWVYRGYYNKGNGYSVRCLRDL